MHPKFLCEDVLGNNNLLRLLTHRQKKDLKVCPMEIKMKDVVLGQLAEDRVQRRAFVARLWTFESQKEQLIPKLRAVPLLFIKFVVDLPMQKTAIDSISCVKSKIDLLPKWRCSFYIRAAEAAAVLYQLRHNKLLTAGCNRQALTVSGNNQVLTISYNKQHYLLATRDNV